MQPEEHLDSLDEIVGQILDAAGVSGPPIDTLAIAQRLGMSVAWDQGLVGRARRVHLQSKRRSTGATILLRPEPRLERRQWAVAHEIGEAWCSKVFERLGIDPEAAPLAFREETANLLANRILLPTAAFRQDCEWCDWELLELKQQYATASHELLARRMLDFEPPIIISIFDQGRLTFRKTNGPGRPPRLSDLEIKCRNEVQSQSQPFRVEGEGGLRVDGWPVYEPDWKREILRSSLDDFI